MRLTLAGVVAATGGTVAEGAGLGPDTVFSAVSTDTRTLAAGSLFVALVGPRFDGHDHLAAARDRGAVAAVVHREAPPLDLPAVRVPDTLVALGALGRSVRCTLGLPVVAITGSVGKTTTKEMTSAMVRAAGRKVLQTPGNWNNRVGLPLTLLGAAGDEQVAVLELGISEPGEMAHLTAICEPDVAVVTAVALAHTQWLGDLDGVAREKMAVADGLRPRGTLVLPFGDLRLVPPEGVRTVTFGWDPRADLCGEELRLQGALGSRFRVEGHELRVPLPGRHNAENALAALAAARAVGVTWEEAAAGLAGLAPAPLRGEIRAVGRNCHVLVDCYNANPRAVEAALETLASLAGPSRRLAVLGEMKELGALTREGHEQAGRAAATHGVDALYLLGEATAWTRDAAVAAGLPEARVRRYPDREALAREVAQDVRPGDWVLVKGSRAMGLEAVADALCREPGTTDQGPEVEG
ncbi:MAG: UDP-N-acetylmuramoyl-tripeptide--D-alanyl-D-alanine ligase [Deltaproteobacteria bacterium]|nr:UDP-N-acetylmuramoyl-tripeptide--D-alanyl-D-alanine ligase [Deltaproteobacteria bacterium]